jgi:two-component system alkaline phosphatase synthesis response regulator PhoP
MGTMMSEAKTVMIVDDEPGVLNMIARILEANNYRTIKAKDGQECLEELKEEVPDVILLDIMMPGLATKEILSAIEGDGRLSEVRIILLSAIHLPEAEEKGLLAGKQVVDFIEKSFTTRRLIDAIENCMTAPL